MSRLIVTAVAALTMLYVGIQSLSFRSESVSNLNLTGADQEAFNMTDVVIRDAATISGNALPRVMILVLLAVLLGTLALTR